MHKRPCNVLFLCTGNSARSILAESLLNHRGRGRFRGFSAGSFPAGRVNPNALALLKKMKIPAEGARSKSWDEFAAPGAPEIDFVITVCDNAANEVCPIWPGHPVIAHWGVEDPAAVTGRGPQVANAFRHAFDVLQHRIEELMNLPLDSLDPPAIQRRLDEIGTDLPDHGTR